jgi:mono/diheme cytochrome c family protein
MEEQMNSRRFIFILLAVAVVVVVAVFGTRSYSGNQEETVKKGEYLVDLGSCNMCHTPKIMMTMGMELDTSRLLSGHPSGDTSSEYTTEMVNEDGWVTKSNFHMTQWSGPWGVSYAANLTPDKASGIGSWSEEDFIRTIRSGKHMGVGRKIQLPMPADNFAKLTDDDLKAIFAYLRSIKPVKNLVPESIPAKKTEEGQSE